MPQSPAHATETLHVLDKHLEVVVFTDVNNIGKIDGLDLVLVSEAVLLS